ncbi:AAA family ATPase [Mesoplasma florum]|uniref:AAA family ATPase n=1 Tax=Mesoplasma florum TaxID=2151 RepID=UPI000D08A402|nr:AAA family ATPase [Mesoplasma florum]AVN60977.1 hypothetical protein CG005_01565 [Mesoplasma florum]
MIYLNIKNFRSFDIIKIDLEGMNFFVGENNLGKSSLLKLIDSLYEITNINLKKNKNEETFLSKNNYDNLAKNKAETIKIAQINSKFEKNKRTFLYFEICNEKVIKRNVISKIGFLDTKGENLIIVNLKYFNFAKQSKVTAEWFFPNKIEMSSYKLNKNEKEKLMIEKDLIDLVENITTKNPSKNSEIEYDYKELVNINERKNSIKLLDKSNEDVFKKNLFISAYNFSTISIEKICKLAEFNLYKKAKDWLEDKEFRISDIYFMRNKVYIPPIRNSFKDFYTAFNDINLTDQESLMRIQKNLGTKTKVNLFFKESGMLDEIFINKVERKGNLIYDLYTPNYKKNGKKMNLSISGEGISQVLPILTKLTTNNSYFFAEQPELHLHPKAQSQLGKFFAIDQKNNIKEFNRKNFKNDYKNNSLENYFGFPMKQYFVETHSLYFINGYRIFLSEDNTKNNENQEVMGNMIFIYPTAEGSAIENIKILKNGKFLGKTSKFNNFFLEESLKVLKI